MIEGLLKEKFPVRQPAEAKEIYARLLTQT